MKRNFSLALALAIMVLVGLPSPALAAEPAHIFFTADAPCPVTVEVFSYTDPTDPTVVRSASGTTPWTLDVYPSTAVSFFYQSVVVCNGVTYILISSTPGALPDSGLSGTTTTVTGHYLLDTTPPTLHLPADMTFEATSASGAVVTYTATADDDNPPHPTVACTPASGSTFGLGVTTVNCSATDAAGNTANGSFTVTVQDTTPPTVTPPSNVTREAADELGAVVTYSGASASDLVDGSLPVTCLPASGSTFPLGTTTVTCTATDAHGNTGSASFTVAVVDTTPPTLALPADTTVETTSVLGAAVTFTASANDLVDGPVPVACSPASGATFPLGSTSVLCSATDSYGNTANGNFTVTVNLIVDNVPPVVTVPPDITAEATSPAGAVVNFSATASDNMDGALTPTCVPASGSIFALGTTSVTCSATDAAGNTGSASFSVTVVDTTPPALNLPADLTVTAANASGAKVDFNASASDLVSGPVPVTCSPASGSLFRIGMTTVNCSATDSRGNTASGSFSVTVQYAADGFNCRGVPGHQILQPINADGSSVFKAGSTVPAKFRVCGTDGVSITTPGVVTNFRLVQIIRAGAVSEVDEAVLSTTPNEVFRSGNQQWIFNLSTDHLEADSTYMYLITLNDGSAIRFQFGLK